MHAGALTDRAVLEAPTRAADGAGGYVPGWSVVATVPAAFRALSGDETLQLGGQVASGGHRIVIRTRADVDPSWRVRRMGESAAYELVAVRDPDGRGLFLELDARRVEA